MATALLLLLFGAGLLWSSRQVSATVRNRSGWPTVLGVALERGTEGPPSEPVQYQPYVRYTYEVEGQTYTNDQFYDFGKKGGWNRDSALIQRIVDRVPDPVPVHYNPDDPAESYLVGTPAWGWWLLRVFGVGALVVGALQMLVALTGPS